MDKVGVYTIYDHKAEVMDTPFFAVTDLMAKRRFTLLVMENKVLQQWPTQFTLWRIGWVDMKTDPATALREKKEDVDVPVLFKEDIAYLGIAENHIQQTQEVGGFE